MLSLVLALLLSDQPVRYKGSTDDYTCQVNKYDDNARQRSSLPKGSYAYVSVMPKDKDDKSFILGIYDFDEKKWHEIGYVDSKNADREVLLDIRDESKECMDNALKTEPLKAK